MSYILDALRRAEAQRERGAVPGIHAQAGATGLPNQARRGSPLVWAAAALAVVALASLAWYLAVREAPRVVVVAAPQVVTVPQPAPVPAPAPPPAPSPVPAPSPAPAAVPGPQPAQAPVQASAPAPAPAPAARPEARKPRAAASRAGAAAPAASAATARNSAVAAPRIYTREELPADIRSQLPPVKIGGSSYSENPAHRMLIANGQVFRENEKISTDLSVEQIRAQAVVLNFRGYRYLVPY